MFNSIQAVLASSLHIPILFVIFRREISFTHLGICPHGPPKTELAVYSTGLYAFHSTSQLTFSSGAWLRSTLEPGYGDVGAFLWCVSVTAFEPHVMKYRGNPFEENRLLLAWIWGQLLSLTAPETKVTERDTVAKVFAK
jgi:hypothetical protein